MSKERTPRTPGDLNDHGKRLWKAILSDLDEGWELDQRELHLLAEAARCADQIGALEAVIDSEGVTSTGSKGQGVVHPSVRSASCG
jgi:hypothetical protein